MGNLHPVMAAAMAPFLRALPAFTYKTQFTLGIDVKTKDAQELIERLKALPSTISVEFGGVYREGPQDCQVHVVTKLTEAQMDDWLYAGEGIEWIGVFQRGGA